MFLNVLRKKQFKIINHLLIQNWLISIWSIQNLLNKIFKQLKKWNSWIPISSTTTKSRRLITIWVVDVYRTMIKPSWVMVCWMLSQCCKSACLYIWIISTWRLSSCEHSWFSHRSHMTIIIVLCTNKRTC